MKKAGLKEVIKEEDEEYNKTAYSLVIANGISQFDEKSTIQKKPRESEINSMLKKQVKHIYKNAKIPVNQKMVSTVLNMEEMTTPQSYYYKRTD